MIFDGKSVLITGGTGSLGRAFVNRLLRGKEGIPDRIVIMSRDELKQQDMRSELLNRHVTTDEIIYGDAARRITFRIGDVRNKSDICHALEGIDIVVHAAAMKQVPTCEYFSDQAIDTNCIGAINLVHAVIEARAPVETVIGLSTDKACKPINVMGFTKALQERIFVAANLSTRTRFACVRYGNILASRGSVIPLFAEQVRLGGPITLTVPHMTRFLMSLEEAVDTICSTVKHAGRGEIFIKTAASATMIDVAQAMIGDHNIRIDITGVRPGEKIHEIVVSEEECARASKHGDYIVLSPMLPELAEKKASSPRGLPLKEVSSADYVLGLQATRNLLAQHGLVPASVAANA